MVSAYRIAEELQTLPYRAVFSFFIISAVSNRCHLETANDRSFTAEKQETLCVMEVSGLCCFLASEVPLCPPFDVCGEGVEPKWTLSMAPSMTFFW